MKQINNKYKWPESASEILFSEYCTLIFCETEEEKAQIVKEIFERLNELKPDIAEKDVQLLFVDLFNVIHSYVPIERFESIDTTRSVHEQRLKEDHELGKKEIDIIRNSVKGCTIEKIEGLPYWKDQLHGYKHPVVELIVSESHSLLELKSALVTLENRFAAQVKQTVIERTKDGYGELSFELDGEEFTIPCREVKAILIEGDGFHHSDTKVWQTMEIEDKRRLIKANSSNQYYTRGIRECAILLNSSLNMAKNQMEIDSYIDKQMSKLRNIPASIALDLFFFIQNVLIHYGMTEELRDFIQNRKREKGEMQ